MWHVRTWKSHAVILSPEPNSAADLVSILFSPGYCGIALEDCTSRALALKTLESTGAQQATKWDLIQKQRRCYWLVSHIFSHTQSVQRHTSHFCCSYLTFSFISTEHPAIMTSWKNISDLQSANLKVVVGGRIRTHIGSNLTLDCPVTGMIYCIKHIPFRYKIWVCDSPYKVRWCPFQCLISHEQFMIQYQYQ